MEVLLTIIIGIIVFIFILGLESAIVYLLWNYLVASLFTVTLITLWQSVAAALLLMFVIGTLKQIFKPTVIKQTPFK